MLTGAEISLLLLLSAACCEDEDVVTFLGVVVPLARLRARPRRSRIWARACSRDIVGVMEVLEDVREEDEEDVERGMVVMWEMVR